MSIFGALNVAVSGMQAQAYALQNVSGNIANSQTTAYKRIDSRFSQMMPDAPPAQQVAGGVTASSVSTNTVQGDIRGASVSTYMAINGQGFFVVAKPESYSASGPTFGGVDLYTRRGDFAVDQNGYLVNGAGYYLMGIPIDAATGNLTGSTPEMLKFESGFLPALPTTSVTYRANLATTPATANYDSSVPGSELLSLSRFSSNPLVGAAVNATITGAGATLSADAPATMSGTASLAALSSAGGTLDINGTPIAIGAGDNAAAVLAAINAQTGTTGVTATLNGANLVLTSADADTGITIGGASTPAVLTELGVAAGTTNPTNLLTQGAASAGQTLTFAIGANPPLTVTFGTGAGQVSTLAELNAELATLAGGTAAANGTGNISIAATAAADVITVSGTATAANFGIRTLTGRPPNGTVIGDDAAAFINDSVSGGAITVYDTAGSAVTVQLRWAKTDSASLGAGHTDTWNMFYQTDSAATGTASAWQNIGINFTFGANGEPNPPVTSVTLANATVNGIPLGNIELAIGSGGVTQFADPNGNVSVNLLQQNGFPAGQLKSVSVDDKGRVVGTYSNGRTIALAQVTIANFSNPNQLKALDGGAYAATADSGVPTYSATGTIVGSALEGSNTDIADEFTKLIVTQQAYSANTKVITTSNEMIRDLLNMLR
ncbi:MAG: flagellar hook-basal body complex protein [Bradyrhizobium sp.]|nr:flagellar hook-basal body complex protein [Bradyrhizobium sp.]